MITRFMLVWIGYWFTFLLQPVTSLYPSVKEAFFLQVSFVLIVVMIASPMGILKSISNVEKLKFDKSFINIVNIGIILSITGSAMVFYDKIFIQNIDFSQGIAFAREQWKNLGQERSGTVSSLYSVIGYFIGSANFLSITILFSKRLDLSDLRRFVLILVSFFVLLINSILMGGRSSLILIIAFILYSYFDGRKFGKLFSKRIYIIGPISISAMIVFYVIYVFIARASANNFSTIEYSMNFLSFLGLKPTDRFVEITGESSIGWLYAVINLTVSYLTHSIATTAAIIDQQYDGSSILFIHFFNIMQKIGIIAEYNRDWFLSGRFPSLPGALYFQFGIFGFLISSVVIGVILTISIFLNTFLGHRPFVLLFCSCVESVLLLSPFLFAGDFVSYPFIISGGTIVIFLEKCLWRRRIAF